MDTQHSSIGGAPKAVVRRYRPSDEDQVIDVWARAAQAAHPFLDGEGRGARERKMREVYLVQADNWVAEVPGEGVVGLLGMLGVEIGGLFVAPEAQGRGIGRLLVEHAVALHGEVTLEVYERNVSARHFYELMGFRETGRRADEENGGLVLIALHRPHRTTC
ncbi:GNAT family N-acetyltransferase [Microtetraspora malaysiensis]|uniref:GNAT family N-acetyltransferase n=1 Tax=Microtetraspora malaysiensis TaxID=161358 RepID=UPI003D911485